MNPLLSGQFQSGYQQHHQRGSNSYNAAQDRDTFTYEVWNNFFSSAGIPESVAHDYAVTFSQHRVKIDMLKEITKDILIDMGIKAMGDIIAILRHAKNLCTQDELKSIGSSSATKTSLNHTNNNNNALSTPTPQPSLKHLTHTSTPTPQPSLKHLTHRAPISTTSRSNPSSTSNKIQSRINLSSGALVASSSNGGASTNQQSSTLSTSSSSNKRHHSSTLPDSLSKRLRPAVSSSERSVHANLPEKTLTVHYPSSSAIARAQQRISGSLPTTASPAIPNSPNAPRAGSSSIRSRLGSNFNISARLDNNVSTSKNIAHHQPRELRTTNNFRPSYTDSRHNDRSFQSNATRIQYRDNTQRNSELRPQSVGRPKSTVFSRLGDTKR